MIDKPISALARGLSQPWGFLATCGALAVGMGIGAAMRWSDQWLLAYNLALSIIAIVLAGIILVAGAKDTAAVQIKLDELIRATTAADNRLIAVEQRTAEELEAVRVHVEG